MHSLRTDKITRILFITVIICFSVGCLREKHDLCSDSVLLKFCYVDYNNLPLKPGFPEIDHLSVFVFDGNGLFVCEKQDSAIQINDEYTMELPFYEGQYQFVVWAGLSDCYNIAPCLPNQTHLQEFILTLKQENDNTILTPPSLLYHGWHETVTLNPFNTEEITIGLKRLTNTIQVIIHAANADIQPQISIQDNNGSYTPQGKMIPGQIIKYLPSYTHFSDKSGTWIADFNVMLLQTDSDAQLIISSPDDGLEYNEKLISGLLAANPNINFNTDHDFTIEITFDNAYVPVNILVNGWEVIFEEVD